MAGLTDFAGLSILGAGEHLSDDGYKFVGQDRRVIDMLLRLAFNHVHTGESVVPEVPTEAPDLTVDPAGGHLEAGTLYYYKHTLVSPEGIETEAGPEASAMTPAQVDRPDPPSLARGSASGTLKPGQYVYALSAYRGEDTLETEASVTATASLPSTAGSTQRVILTLPTLPMGAEGWNVYRRIPNGSGLYYLESIDMTVVDPPETYTDDGSVSADPERRAPNVNTTSTENSILVEYPSDDPVPVGYTWRIYRTATNGDWDDSLLVHVVEETTEGSGVVVDEYLDTGDGTQEGSPPTQTINFTWPEPIDASQIGGDFGPPQVIAPGLIEFYVPGPVTVAIVPELWVSPWYEGIIRPMQANLDFGSEPDVDDVVIQVSKSHDGGTFYETVAIITIPAGENRVTSVQPLPRDDPDEYGAPDLALGDLIQIEVTQAGGGTNTDEGLRVQIPVWVRDRVDVGLEGTLSWLP